MLSKSKLNSFETLVSQALIDMEISHKNFNTNFERERQIWEDARKCEKCKWETRRKTRKY